MKTIKRAKAELERFIEILEGHITSAKKKIEILDDVEQLLVAETLDMIGTEDFVKKVTQQSKELL